MVSHPTKSHQKKFKSSSFEFIKTRGLHPGKLFLQSNPPKTFHSKPFELIICARIQTLLL